MKAPYLIPVIEIPEQWLEEDLLNASDNYYGDSGSAGGNLDDGYVYNL